MNADEHLATAQAARRASEAAVAGTPPEPGPQPVITKDYAIDDFEDPLQRRLAIA